MERYQNNLQDQFGNAISGVTVTVRRVSDGGIATIFSDNSGTGKANPFTNDADGEFFFYAADDRYDIFFTGPITDQKDDVLLLDISTTGTTIRVNTDINTATPPTTEAVTGRFEIWDLADNDRLSFYGFNTSNTLQVKSFMRGGAVLLVGVDVGGTQQNIFRGDPDSDSAMYRQGVERFTTDLNGVAIQSDGNLDTEQRRLEFNHQDGTNRAIVGFIGSGDFVIRNQIHGRPVEIQGENNAGSIIDLYTADPDGAAHMYYAGESRINTRSAGQAGISATGNTDTEDCRFLFLQLDATAKGSVGYVGGADLRLRGSIHGGSIILEAEDSGGAIRTILTGDPDAVTTLRGDTTVSIEAGSGNITLDWGNQINFRTSDESASDIGMGAEVRHNDDSFYPVGMNTAPELNDLDSGNLALAQASVGKMLTYNTGTARSLNFNNTASIKIGALWALLVGPSAGTLTGDGGTGVQIRYWNGTGWTTTASAGNITIGEGQYTIWKETNTLYWISGPNLS